MTELTFTTELSIDKIANKSYDASKYFLNHKNTTHQGQEYTVVHYDKDLLTADNLRELKNCRSLVFNSAGHLVCVSPPKCVAGVYDMTMFASMSDEVGGATTNDDVYVEPHVEGTMVNMFYDTVTGGWVYSTRSNIGATNSFFRVNKRGKSFRTMFDECARDCGLEVDLLPRDCSYSFIIQHTENRLVSRFSTNRVVLARVYKIVRGDNNGSGDTRVFAMDHTNSSVYPVPHTIEQLFDQVPLLELISGTNERGEYVDEPISVQEYLEDSAEIESDQYIGIRFSRIGINIISRKSGDRIRIRDARFDAIRHMRGNQPKLEYHYHDLLKMNMVGLFLSYYPEHRDDFEEFHNKIDRFATTLYNNYVGCYIKRARPLKSYPREYRTHMFNLHTEYKQNRIGGVGRGERWKGSIQLNHVNDYIARLSSGIILYSVNFCKRPTEKADGGIGEGGIGEGDEGIGEGDEGIGEGDGVDGVGVDGVEEATA